MDEVMTYMPVGEIVPSDFQPTASIQAQMDSDNKVDSFKENLAQTRFKLNNAIQRKTALGDEIKSLLNQREDLIAMFRANISQNFPELAGLSLKDIKAQIIAVASGSYQASAHGDPAHPAFNLWQAYHKDIQGLVGAISSRMNQYKSLVKQVAGFEAEQFQIMDAYGAYAASSPAPVPSVEEIEAEVVDPLPTNVEVDVELIEQVSAIELLTPETQDAIMLQEAELQATNIEDQMMKAVAVPHDSKRTLLTIAGVLALGYIFFGGSKN